MNARATLLLSLLLHAACLYFFMHIKKAETQVEKIEVEYREMPKGTPQSHARAGKNPNAGRGGPSLAQLRPSWKSVTEPGPNTGRLIDPDARGSSEWPEEAWGSRGGKLEEAVNFISYERIFTEIEGLLFYPSQLGRKGIEGFISARLFFNESKNCEWHKTRIEGASPYLKFYIAALLKKLCRLENIQHLALKENQFIDLNFNFEIIGVVALNEPEQNVDAISGNVMRFRRTFVKPIGIVPIGPVYVNVFMPTMVFVNFPWLLEKWDHYVNHRDPLDEFKD